MVAQGDSFSNVLLLETNFDGSPEDGEGGLFPRPETGGKKKKTAGVDHDRLTRVNKPKKEGYSFSAPSLSQNQC